MSGAAAPRIYCIAAGRAPVVAVFRRGPSDWSHIGRWDLEAGRYEPGAWFRGRIYARRSDVSPDGRWLCYFALKPAADWEHGSAFVALSKLPWLTALHAFGTCGTWTRGYHFTERVEDGDAGIRLPIGWGLRATPVVQFAVERRRGWVEMADSPPRDPADAWDERRRVRMARTQPGGTRRLIVERVADAGPGGASQAVDGVRCAYGIATGAQYESLPDLQWADWDREGHLLAATRTGRLQRIALDGAARRVVFDEDLSVLAPRPVPAPDWARRW